MGAFFLGFGPDGRWSAGAFAAGFARLGAGAYCVRGPRMEGDRFLAAPAVAARPGPGLATAVDGEALSVIVGRIAGRAALAGELGLGSGATSAEVLLAAWHRWGDDLTTRLDGGFAGVVIDRRHRRLLACRDPLGSRTLFLHRAGGTLWLASEEAPLLAGPAAGAELDDETLLAFLSLDAPAPGATFFRTLEELPVGRMLLADGGRVELRAAVAPSARAPRLTRDEEWVEAFRAALAAAVADALDGAGDPGVMMSGGLDSGSVAAFARHSPALAGRRLHAFSWVFDRLADCDERRWMRVLVGELGLRHHQLPADDLGPLAEASDWPWNPGRPHANPFRLAKQRLYGAAAAAGVEVLLTGAAGDLLFTAPHAWLGDLLRVGRPLSAAFRAGGELRRGRARFLAKAGYTALLGRGPKPRRIPARWLTAQVRSELSSAVDRRSRPIEARRRALTGPLTALGVATEAAWAGAAGIDLRDPYRDRRLVELALAAPAHLAYRDGRNKDLLRRAVAGVLPNAVRLRRARTSLEPLFARGLFEQGREVRDALLASPDALWRRWVDPAWLMAAASSERRLPPDDAVALWRCVALEQWRSGGLSGTDDESRHPVAEGNSE